MKAIFRIVSINIISPLSKPVNNLFYKGPANCIFVQILDLTYVNATKSLADGKW